MAKSQICTYKGRTYRLLWSGTTQYGQRCKLGFMDGSKEFWADAASVSNIRDGSSEDSTTGRRRSRSGRCRECGGALTDAPHHRAMGGLCGSCAFDEYDM